MNVNRITSVVAFAGGLALATGAMAQDAAKKPHVPLEKTIGQVKATGPVPSSPSSTRQGLRLTVASSC